MAHAFKLSEFGLKLIKAYEGFRATETALVSGQRVIGYGHRYLEGDDQVISRPKAEYILLQDLEPYEAMINESIYAPLTQSQFDALVSLSYNIGPKAFSSSNVLHCLNNGRPLEAAAGFDEWRKSVIDGKTYVVDALVRRRTAEKALFLRPIEGVVAAPRNEIPPLSDGEYPRNDEETPTYGRYENSGVVARAPYDLENTTSEDDAQENGNRRREDGPAGTLTLSEIVPDDESDEEGPLDLPANEDGLSPIAVAAAEVSERLEALIADRPEPAAIDLDVDLSEPEPAAVKIVEKSEKPAELPTPSDSQTVEPARFPANDGAHEDYRRPGRERQSAIRTPDVYITKVRPEPVIEEPAGSGAYWATLLIGATLLGGGAVRWFLSPEGSLDPVNAFLAPVATLVGGMIVLGALYYLIKSISGRN